MGGALDIRLASDDEASSETKEQLQRLLGRFYLRLGYKGRCSMHKKFPLPGRVTELRLRRLEGIIGDLEAGGDVPMASGGRVPSLA